VRKGKYPGGKKSYIFSKVIWNGGATDERVDELWELEREKERGKESRVGMKRNSRMKQNDGGLGEVGRGNGRGVENMV